MTELTEFQRKIAALSLDLELRLNEPMERHTSLRIGGAEQRFEKDAVALVRLRCDF